MPFFKSTKNIFDVPDEDEVFDENWMDSNVLILPPKTDWDYKREMLIEDVDIWEQIYFGGDFAVYAAWSPYAEFYMIVNFFAKNIEDKIETFYGKHSSKKVIKRCKELGLPISVNKIWVDNNKMWLYK